MAISQCCTRMKNTTGKTLLKGYTRIVNKTYTNARLARQKNLWCSFSESTACLRCVSRHGSHLSGALTVVSLGAKLGQQQAWQSLWV